MARICPPEKATQFFGFYGLSGTVTLFLGPLMVASTTDWLQSQQLGFASLIVLMLVGTVILFKVKKEQSMIAPSQCPIVPCSGSCPGVICKKILLTIEKIDHSIYGLS